jgi:hypothetical protein
MWSNIDKRLPMRPIRRRDHPEGEANKQDQKYKQGPEKLQSIRLRKRQNFAPAISSILVPIGNMEPLSNPSPHGTRTSKKSQGEIRRYSQ